MSSHHHEGDSKSFSLPVFLSFALVFCVLVLMAQCHGPYKPYNLHGGEHATEHKVEGHEPASHQEHATGDSTAHKVIDTSAHKTEAHEEAHH